MKRIEFKKERVNLTLIFSLVGLVVGCATTTQYSQEGWNVLADPEKEILTIEHRDLGVVVRDAHLNLRKDDELFELSGWSVKEDKDKLTITTKEPYSTTWEFKITGQGVGVSCSAANVVITGIAPSSEERIPARVAEPEKMHTFPSPRYFTGAYFEEKSYIPSQAGRVMYTSLGLVDALNLHSLFDRKTNIVIQFSKKSKLSRNVNEATLMDVEIPVTNGATLLKLIPDYYTKVLGMKNYIPYDDTYHKVAPTGWNHWLAFYSDVTEEDIVKHADWIAENLKDYGFLHVQLDEGYDNKECRRWWQGDWYKNKFPHGPKWLSDYIESKGLIPGMWTVPYCYCIEELPSEWFLRDKEGNILMDYQGGGELDFTREDVIRDYWRPLLESWKSQGWKYYKFDMGSTVPRWDEGQNQFYDTTKSCYDVSRETSKILREIMGPEIWYTNHPDNWGGRMGVVDVVGCGADPGPGWQRMNNFLEVISNNTYQNHIVWYSDPDCCVIRDKPTRVDKARGRNDFVTLEQARTCISLISLAGLQFLSGDDLTELSEDRLELIKKSMPITPIIPIDLFGRGRDKSNYPEIIDLKVNAESGVYDVISVTNWSNAPASHTVSFNEDLALSNKYSYVVFDFWNQELKGIFEGKFSAELPAHGTRVFMISRLLDGPQLLATSRHITGAFSIKTLNWDPSEFTLSGISKTVPDAQYSLFIYVPPEVNVSEVDANALNLSYNINQEHVLEVSFTGQKEPVNWIIEFKK